MISEEILQKVQAIFRDELDNDAIVVTPETTADDIEEWDSLSHIQLVVAIEKSFNVKFNAREIQSWKNVGEMCDAITGKLRNRASVS